MEQLLADEESAFSISALKRLDEICGRFEDGWNAGDRPRLEDFLEEVDDSERAPLLGWLLRLEAVYRRKRGETPSAQEYQRRFPELAAEVALDWDEGREITLPAKTQILRGGPERGEGSTPSIPGYELLGTLGKGGMGVVYQARHVRLGRVVALKMILEGGHAGTNDRRRFQREAEIIARLHHPHIVQIHEVGEHDGSPFFTMEFCPGGSLADRLDGTPLGSREAAQLVRTLAGAIHAAHQAGVIHRDLKPANILLDVGDSPKVADFGLAKQADAPERTGTGNVLGTPSYMAPEQAAGQGKEVGPATDVYALGAILYECLTGRPPFRAATVYDTLLQVVQEQPVRPRQLQSKVPLDLETICLMCLHKSAGRRYATAEALADDLGRFLDHRPIRARRIGAVGRAGRWCRRNPIVAGLTATIAALLVAVAAASAFAANRLSEELDGRIAAEKEAHASERMARLREAEALIGQAHGIRFSRRPGQRFEALAALQKAAAIGRELRQPPEWFDHLRNEMIAAMALPDLQITPTRGRFPPGSQDQGDLSDDFELYARVNAKGGCTVRRLSDDEEVASFPETGSVLGVHFGPGRRLLLQSYSSRRYQIWDLSGTKPVSRVDRHNVPPVCHTHFRPDGRLLALVHVEGSISVIESDTGVEKYRLRYAKVFREPAVVLHPTEPVVAICSSSSNEVQVADLKTGETLVSLTMPWVASHTIIWSPDGRTLAVTDGTKNRVRLYAFDRANAALHLSRTLEVPDGVGGNGATLAAFDPSGDRLMTLGCWSGIHRLFDVSNGRLLSSIQVNKSAIGFRRFDASGERYGLTRSGSQGDRVGLFAVAAGREYRTLLHEGPGRCYHEVGDPAVHPGGRLAALGLSDGLALFDLESGRELAFVPIEEGGGNTCFDGAGNLLVNNYAGLFRWPVRSAEGRLIVGPPERLPFPLGDRGVSASRDGKVIAQAAYQGGVWVLHPQDIRPRQLDKARCNWVSVSPDGRWAACGFNTHTVTRIKVYETATGKCVFQPRGRTDQICRFSPDGQWLAISGSSSPLYATGSWTVGPRLGENTGMDVSPDGRLAVTRALDWGTDIHLMDWATGKELAILEAPDQAGSYAIFTPDGTRLVKSAPDGLRVWDLRLLREGLAKAGFDWDAPSYPKGLKAAPKPLEVEIVGAELFEAKKK